MDLRSLKFFRAVAEAKGFVRAADVLHLTQPNLSRTIRELEKELGCKLFERTRESANLTEKGRILLARTNEIFELMEKTRQDVTASSEIAGNIHIACGETEGIRRLVRLMRKLSEKHPKIRYCFHSGNGEDVMRRLDAGTADFGIVFEPVDLSEVNYLKLPWTEHWGVLVTPSHPLAEAKVTARELSKFPLIISSQSMLGGAFKGWLGNYASTVNVVATYSLPNTGRIMAEEELGAMLAFEDVMPIDDSKRLVFRRLEPNLPVSCFLVWKKGQIFTQPAQLLLNSILDQQNALAAD